MLPVRPLHIATMRLATTSEFPLAQHSGSPEQSIVERERQMTKVERALAMTRLLRLTGGAVRQTRLALEVARELARTYPAGVADRAGAALGPTPAAASCGRRIKHARTVKGLRAALHPLVDRRLALERVAADSGQLRASRSRLRPPRGGTLGSCPRLRILATSREALGVGGEAPGSCWDRTSIPCRVKALSRLAGLFSSAQNLRKQTRVVDTIHRSG